MFVTPSVVGTVVNGLSLNQAVLPKKPAQKTNNNMVGVELGDNGPSDHEWRGSPFNSFVKHCLLTHDNPDVGVMVGGATMDWTLRMRLGLTTHGTAWRKLEMMRLGLLLLAASLMKFTTC